MEEIIRTWWVYAFALPCPQQLIHDTGQTQPLRFAKTFPTFVGARIHCSAFLDTHLVSSPHIRSFRVLIINNIFLVTHYNFFQDVLSDHGKKRLLHAHIFSLHRCTLHNLPEVVPPILLDDGPFVRPNPFDPFSVSIASEVLLVRIL